VNCATLRTERSTSTVRKMTRLLLL